MNLCVDDFGRVVRLSIGYEADVSNGASLTDDYRIGKRKNALNGFACFGVVGDAFKITVVKFGELRNFYVVALECLACSCTLVYLHDIPLSFVAFVF